MSRVSLFAMRYTIWALRVRARQVMVPEAHKLQARALCVLTPAYWADGVLGFWSWCWVRVREKNRPCPGGGLPCVHKSRAMARANAFKKSRHAGGLEGAA